MYQHAVETFCFKYKIKRIEKSFEINFNQNRNTLWQLHNLKKFPYNEPIAPSPLSSRCAASRRRRRESIKISPFTGKKIFSKIIVLFIYNIILTYLYNSFSIFAQSASFTSSFWTTAQTSLMPSVIQFRENSLKTKQNLNVNNKDGMGADGQSKSLSLYLFSQQPNNDKRISDAKFLANQSPMFHLLDIFKANNKSTLFYLLHSKQKNKIKSFNLDSTQSKQKSDGSYHKKKIVEHHKQKGALIPYFFQKLFNCLPIPIDKQIKKKKNHNFEDKSSKLYTKSSTTKNSSLIKDCFSSAVKNFSTMDFSKSDNKNQASLRDKFQQKIKKPEEIYFANKKKRDNVKNNIRKKGRSHLPIHNRLVREPLINKKKLSQSNELKSIQSTWNNDNNNDFDYITTMPFEITTSLELALSTVTNLPITESFKKLINKTTTPISLLSTTSVYYAIPLETPETTTDLFPWEQKRGEVKTKNVKVAAIPKLKSVDFSTEFPITNEKKHLTNIDLLKFKSHERFFIPAQNSFKKFIKAPQTMAASPSASTITPRGQFYADQHISYGQYGRSTGNSNINVVYDPNVLKRPYGFSGIIPTTDLFPSSIIFDINSYQSPNSNFPNFKLNEKKLKFDTFNFSQEKMRKPFVLGTKNFWGLGSFHKINKQNFNDFQQVNYSSQQTSFEPTYFYIPPSTKLSTARAVKVVAHGQSNKGVSETNKITNLTSSTLFDNKKIFEPSSNDEIVRLTISDSFISKPKEFALTKLQKMHFITTKPMLDEPMIPASTFAANTQNYDVKHQKYVSANASDYSRSQLNLNLHNEIPLQELMLPLETIGRSLNEGKTNTNNLGRKQTEEIATLNEFDANNTEMCFYNDTEDLPKSTTPIFLDLTFSFTSAIDACFRRSNNCIMQLKPIERQINFSEEQCINFCGRHSYCISVTYSNSLKICNIYNLRNGTGTARLYKHTNYSYFEAKRRPTNSLDETLISDCWKDNVPKEMQKIAELPSAKLVDSHDLTTPFAIYLNNNEDNRDENIKTINSEFPKKALKDICPDENDIIVFKSPGYRIINFQVDFPDKANIEIMKTPLTHQPMVPLEQTSSETDCIFSCLINFVQGQTPYDCLAATFNVVNRRCLLYDSGSNFNKNIHLIPDTENNHYEKGCISMDLVELCKGYPIIRHAQKTLLGFAIMSKYAATFVECIEMCFADRQKAWLKNSNKLENRHYCKSIMYFYEETNTNNCILNSENRESAPSFFVDEIEALVDYASFESCYEIRDFENNKSGETTTISTEKLFKSNQRIEFKENISSENPKHSASVLDNSEKRRRSQTTMYNVDNEFGFNWHNGDYVNHHNLHVDTINALKDSRKKVYLLTNNEVVSKTEH